MAAQPECRALFTRYLRTCGIMARQVSFCLWAPDNPIMLVVVLGHLPQLAMHLRHHGMPGQPQPQTSNCPVLVLMMMPWSVITYW